MAIDDKYINYNLSLVDPNNITVPTTPLERKEPQIKVETDQPKDEKQEEEIKLEDEKQNKEEIDVSPGIYFENKQAKEVETPTPILEKEDVDISTYAEADGRMTEQEESSKVELHKGSILMAKAFPIDPIDPDFNTHVMKEKEMSTEYDTLDTTKEDPMENFFVHGGNRGKKNEKNIEIKIENNFDVRILDQEHEKKKNGKADSLYDTKSLKRTDRGKDDSVNIMDLSPFTKGKVIKYPYLNKEMTLNEAVTALNKKSQISNLGAIHVYPVNPGGEGGISSKYIIPFEFNPKITESGVSAKYETVSLLSRIGDIQSYIKTSSNTIQLNTKYQVLSADKEVTEKVGESDTGSWMNAFTLRNLQSIEMAYRGLVFPQTSKKDGSFFRPPVIKVVFESHSKDSYDIKNDVPFNNLLTYPYKMRNETKVYHKTFIATKVDIRKDWDNYPLILNKKNDGILDLQGFDVSISLTEVDPMYIGVLPSFEDYYSTVPTLTEV